MSHETYAWAKEQRCGSPVTKAVLLEIANWAKPSGLCEFLSVDRISEVIEVDARTVRRHIAKLEDCDLLNGGLGLIRRVHRYAEKGGQLPNAFELVGYEPPLSLSRGANNAAGPAKGKKAASPHVGQGDNLSSHPDNLSSPPCPPCQGEGDNGVTRLGFILGTTLEHTNTHVERAGVERLAWAKPDWADDQVWHDFMLNRQRKQQPNTVSTFEKFMRDIQACSSPEWPPPKLLAHAAAAGWASINLPETLKLMNGARHANNGNDKRDGVAKALDRRLEQLAGSPERPANGDGAIGGDGPVIGIAPMP